MLRYLVRRILGSIPLLLFASFIVFWLIRAAVDPLAKYKHKRNSTELIAQQTKALGLDKPLVVQWWNWFKDFLHGDLGISTRTHDPVWGMITHALWPTVQLLFWATIVSVIVALALGTYSALKQYSAGDYVFTGISYIGISMPDFFFGLLAIAFLVTAPKVWFNLDQPIFYSIGLHSSGQSGMNLDYFRHLALPVAVLAFTSVATWSRFHRSEMLSVMNAEYVRTARAKGVPRRQVITRHAFRNSLTPFITVAALDTAFLFGGVIIAERLFSINGMGTAFLTALGAGDAPFLLAWFMITAIAVVVVNLMTDVFYVVLDPRIRLS